jgi:hypothetical protein
MNKKKLRRSEEKEENNKMSWIRNLLKSRNRYIKYVFLPVE